MIYPDYTNSIVNLTSSVLKAFDVNSLYCPLEELDGLKKYKNIIFINLDGLGFEYLQKYGQDSYLNQHCLKKLTSVFPSTTAAATTALETGVPAQQHGLTGWFTYLKELGIISTVLPFKPRYGGLTFPNNNIERKDIFTEKRIGDKIKQTSFIIYPDKIVDGKVNKESKKIIAYKNFNSMFLQINKAVSSSNRRKYIYAYWDKFDYLCHVNGCDSKIVNEHFWKLDKKIASFVKSLKKTNSAVIITADHGLINTSPEKVIYIQDYPELYDMLTMPLCGEARLAYCYVHPDKALQFENYIKNNLNHCCEIYKSSELLDQGVFGLFQPHPKLKDRIGDYILVMKDNYIIKDFLMTEEKKYHIGNHGGTSKEEMYVPLIFCYN